MSLWKCGGEVKRGCAVELIVRMKWLCGGREINVEEEG